MQNSFKCAGCVATFYSFKGGVGRSFLLANVAVTLAQWGYRVLCVDWDLEAPGLDVYFSEYLGERPGGPGLVELVQNFAAAADSPPDWSAHVAPVGLRAFRGVLHLMSSGRQDCEYAGRVQTLDWASLYNRGLGTFLETVRQDWVSEYDLVLIDSRTGITDIGGICTIQLPDILVPVFTANRQNLDGVVDIVNRATARREALPLDRSGLLVLPVLSRFESQVEYDLSQDWLKRVAEQVGPLTEAWRHRDSLAIDLLTQIKIPYVPFWSYGEKLAVLAEPKPSPTQISYAIHSVAGLLARRLDSSQQFLSDRDAYVADARKADLTVTRKGGPVRIFISSTSELSYHRVAVRNAIQRSAPGRYNVQDWEDLSLSSLAVFAPTLRNYDVFLGIYGFRYGAIMPNSGQSGIEVEYREAKASGTPIVALLMADDAPLSAKDIDRGLSAERIDKLRTEIAANHTVDFFRTSEEAAVAAVGALRRLFDSDEKSEPVSRKSPRSYISYRRSDTSDIADRLYDHLRSTFGRDSVFMDMAHIPIGVDFRTMILDAIRQSDVVLVVIGSRWLDGGTVDGHRLLDNENDFVRLEIETALQGGIRVIPVIADNATFPNPTALPKSIRELAFRNALRIHRGTAFHEDVDRLIHAIKQATDAPV